MSEQTEQSAGGDVSKLQLIPNLKIKILKRGRKILKKSQLVRN